MSLLKDRSNQRFVYYIIFFLLGVFSLVNRDLTPSNELKYISIALESLNQHHFFTFYDHGAIYADKPPFYFWLIMLGIKLFGTQGGIIFTGVCSLLPMLGICEIFYQWTKRELTTKNGLTSVLILLTSILFFICGLTLRMDMMMAFFICLSLFIFYQSYELNLSHQPLKYKPYLILLSIFLATMAKGPVGFALPIVSILAFLAYKRQVRLFFKFIPIKGIAAFIALIGLWFLAMYIEGGKDYLYALTLDQVVRRGFHATTHQQPFYYYFNIALSALLPWTLLIIAGFIRFVKTRKAATEKQVFFILVSVIGTIMLSSVGSKLQIYFLPLVPFIIFAAMIALNNVETKSYWQWGLYPVALCLIIAPIVAGLFFSNQFKKLPIDINDIYLLLVAMLCVGVLTLIQLKKLNYQSAIKMISFGVFSFLFITVLLVPKYNDLIGSKVLAQELQGLYEQNGSVGYYSYDDMTSENMEVYLDQPINRLDSSSDITDISLGSVIVVKRRSEELFSRLKKAQISPRQVLKRNRTYIVVI